MNTIEVTGESIAALGLKHRQHLVLSGVKQPTVQEQAMGVRPKGSTFDEWLATEMKITEIISPDGMWSYGPHILVFESEDAMLEFKSRHMG